MFVAQLHEWGYTYNGPTTFYELTPRELHQLQVGFKVLNEQRHPEGGERGQVETRKHQMKTASKNRARQRMIERRKN